MLLFYVYLFYLIIYVWVDYLWFKIEDVIIYLSYYGMVIVSVCEC